MARVGRPATPEDEQVTVVRIENRHVDLLDRVIREHTDRNLGSVVVTGPRWKIPGTGVTTWRSKIEGINYSRARRDLLGQIIEDAVRDEVLHPTRVLPWVPRGPYTDLDLVEISTWAEEKSIDFTQSAPIAVQLVLARNELRQKEQESSREEFLERLRAATRRASEPGDDENTP